MEMSHSLTLNEGALNQLPEQKRPLFVFEWLRYLDKVLIVAQKSDIKECQNKLVEQLLIHIQSSPGPPTRKLIAQCLATLFSVGDTFLLFDTVNKCNDILKNKDDSPSFLPTRLAAITCVGSMYEKLGRMMGRSYEETVQILIRSLKNAESQMRIEIMVTLEKVCAGMGNAISNVHRDIYKVTRHCLTDRVMAVRVAAAKCLTEMIKHTSFLYTTELESLGTLCFRGFENSNYEVRCSIARLLGLLIAMTQKADKPISNISTSKLTRSISLDEALGVLMSGFLRGGVSFLKGTGEMIKGTTAVNREVRVGVTHAYVVLMQQMGSVWLERNLQKILTHILDLVANPKAASSHVDAVYSRKCINFILRSVVGKMIGEKVQISTCKELVQIVAKQMNTIDFNPENAKDSNQETLFSQHLLVCALQELGSLVLILGTTAQNLLNDQQLNFVDTTCAVLIHPCLAARLAAAWCLRCICVAVPSQITLLIDRFIDAMENMRSSPEAISGYSCSLAAVLGSVKFSPLGIPHTKGKVVFNTAEELLRTASQNSRLSLSRTQAGWLLIGSIMTLGVPVVKGLLPRMHLLWRNSFPKSAKELENEKARGDAFTWQVTLEGRAGALSVMHSFLLHCPELITDESTRRLITPIESALAMLVNISPVLKTYGQQLKAPAAIVRLRLYETLTLLPANALESSYTHLLRMLVAEFTLAENPANTTTSLLKALCHANDSVILGSWLQDTDHHTIEDQLQPNSAAGSGALEHDPCSLYRPLSKTEFYPGPLPLGVTVIDMSVVLFGLIFPKVANKHRLQMLDHFAECIKHAKTTRQEAVQMNIFAALLSGLKGLTETKCNIGQEDVKKSATNLIITSLVSTNSVLRCAASEALGRIAQVVGDSRFTAELAQTSFDRLKSARDVVTRTGHSLALGCLHRYVGGMGSSQHLNTSVSILLALAQDGSSPVVQVWSLYALSLIADSGGPMFRGYVEPSLSLCIKLLLNVPQTHVDVHQCVGRVLSALITTIGPELQGNIASICTARSSFLCACAIMHDHLDPFVQAEATGCLQQLHLFAPRYVNLSNLVLTLCRTLSSDYLILRKAAVSCLRQLTQREAKEVCDHAVKMVPTEETELSMTEIGLPGYLFGMLDTETDPEMIKNIHDTIMSMLQMLAAENLTQWLGLCKNVLTVATDLCSTSGTDEMGVKDLSNATDTDIEDDDMDMEYHAEDTTTHPAIQPRWPTRVFAAECVQKIISSCENSNVAHFDLHLAKEYQLTKSKGDYLVLHLSDLIRMAFMAATSDSDHLRLAGLKTLQEVIERFARVPEPEFPGHLLLEQFQAQVGAALRPAFAQDTPSHVTASACEVCSTWIGSGVARDMNDLRRVHQLLVSSLSKLNTKTNTTQLYNESMATLEKLSILRAWAEVYIIAMVGNGTAPASVLLKKLSISQDIDSTEDHDGEFGKFECSGESLLALVRPELTNLSRHWLAALKDHALLLLPNEYSGQLPHDGGAFYTTDTMHSSKPHYMVSWPPILYASSLWLNAEGFAMHNETFTPSDNNARDDVAQNSNNNNSLTISHGSISADRFHMVFGICMEALCSTRSSEKNENIIICLQSLNTILNSHWTREQLVKNDSLNIELCNVLHRLILTRDSVEVQLLCIEILKQTLEAAKHQLEASTKEESNAEDDTESTSREEVMDNVVPGKSHIYAVLEVCFCLFVRQIPTINPMQSVRLTIEQMQKQWGSSSNGIYKISQDSGVLISSAIQCLESLTPLCSSKGALSILPTILYLTTTIIKEIATKSINDGTILANSSSIQAALKCLKIIAIEKYAKQESTKEQWCQLMQSAFGRLIDLMKTGCEETKLDEVTMMLAIAMFLLNLPSKYVAVPSLQYPCINHFHQCLQSDSIIIRVKCIQTLRSIFTNADLTIATPYIHALAPRIMQNMYAENVKNLKTDTELSLVLESITTVETLIVLAEPDKRRQMLAILIPVLISLLLDQYKINVSPKQCVQLHEHSLQWLKKIGPKYPQEFKNLMSENSGLKLRLETAIRNSGQTSGNNQQKNRNEIENPTSKLTVLQKPSIQLKTDFSNFT